MARKLELELSDRDVDYFRQVMDETWRRNANQSEKEILDEARRLLERSRNSKAEAPQYVRQRLEDVGTLISMLEDTEWPLEQEDRERTVAALSYFAEPQDIIPDNIPGLGFLDDALLSELLMSSMATVSKKCIAVNATAAPRKVQHQACGRYSVAWYAVCVPSISVTEFGSDSATQAAPAAVHPVQRPRPDNRAERLSR